MQLCLTAGQSLLNTHLNAPYPSGKILEQENDWKDWESTASTGKSILGVELLVVSGKAG